MSPVPTRPLPVTWGIEVFAALLAAGWEIGLFAIPDVCAATASEVFATGDDGSRVPAEVVAPVPPAGLVFDVPALLELLVVGLLGGVLGLFELLGGMVKWR